MALIVYIRASDVRHLVQDINLEVMNAFYVPVFDSFEDLDIGDSDPDKPGAIAAYVDGSEYRIAVYNGDGTWSEGGGPGSTAIPDNSLDPFSTTSAILDAAYPDSKTGDIVYNESDYVMWTKLDAGKWTKTALDVV